MRKDKLAIAYRTLQILLFLLQNSPLNRIIGLDIGTVRTGIATAYSEIGIASAIETVETKNLIQRLNLLRQEEPIVLVVIGQAIQMNGTASESMSVIESYANKIINQGFEVAWQDERFTSKMATKSLIESGASKKMRRDKSVVDRVSAALILQSYLDKKV